MKAHIAVTALTALAFTVAFSSGCGTDQETTQWPEPETLSEGLTILEQAPAQRIVAAYKKIDRVVFFESRVGPQAPEYYRNIPGFPEYEMDVRFVDQEGNTFIWQKGGDEFVDPVWRREVAETFHPVDNGNRLRDWELASEASEALGNLSLPNLAIHVDTIRDLGVSVRKDLPKLQHAIKAIDPKEVELNKMEANYDSSFGAGYWFIQIYKKCIYLCAGDHSATVLWGWNGSNSYVAGYSCNHGTCANKMDRKCDLGWYYRPSTWNYQDEMTTSNSIAGSCRTGYAWGSGSGSHNCHDDTRLQMANVVYGNQQNGYRLWCDDSSTNKWKAPDCSTSTTDGYRHPGFCTVAGTCGGYSSKGKCYCDSYCVSAGDCCPDGPC